jgi:hypothetical protein
MKTKSTAAQPVQERVLDQIGEAARLCRELEQHFAGHPAPELGTIIKLHRVLLLKLSAQTDLAPELLDMVKELIKPVMDWERLEEKRKDRELAEKKYQDQVEAQKAAAAREGQGPAAGALTTETLEKIEQELSLL